MSNQIIDDRDSENFTLNRSVYVTIMNKLTNNLSLVKQTNNHGTYNPTNLPPGINSNGQIYFILEGDITTGSKGSVTYQVDGTDQRITFAFKCPRYFDNDLSIPLKQTEPDVRVSYYGRNQPIQWNPYGTNWGPPNNFPKRGSPLYALFVIRFKRN